MGESGSGRRPRREFPWLRAALLLAVCAGIVLPFTPVAGKVKRAIRELTGPRVDQEKLTREVETRLRKEFDERLKSELARQAAAARPVDESGLRQRIEAELRKEFEARERAAAEASALGLPPATVTDVRNLRSGIPFKTEFKLDKGVAASKERVDPASYTAFYQVTVRVPEAVKTLAGLEQSNPSLGKVLPGLSAMLADAKVSPWFAKLYDAKVQRNRRNATALNELVSKHNFYDCETILDLTAPGGRKVFLVQAEMDVVSDGSDGDRLATMPPEIVNSTNYQPFTSWAWPKTGKQPNPMIAGWEQRIKNAEKELADKSTTADRRKWLRERITYLKTGIDDMKRRSFLIADHDPFIVVPTTMFTTGRGDPRTPKVGDYGVVIHGGKVYPALVGDAGPTYKIGEASLRLAKEINPRATPYSRPESDLKVSYVIFPGTADTTRGPPDYAAWRQRCHELLNEIGGLGRDVTLHEWANTLPQPPAPEPEPPASDPGTADPPAPAPEAAPLPAGN